MNFDFNAMMEELDLLKSQRGDGDGKIKKAAEEGHEELDGDEDGSYGDGGEDDGYMGKSFEFEVDGEKVRGFDATALVKSLQDRQAGIADEMQKGFGQVAALLQAQTDLLKSQGVEMASLRAKVADLSGQGKGRKSAVAVHGRESLDPLAKSLGDDGGWTVDTLLAKADALFEAGKLGTTEYRQLDVCVRNGIQPDAKLLRKVVATQL
ncbi:hypothetical protein SAMN02949497_1208 [Methylomagnum ishizawai]|uniref:Uncharacterized protein n=1 Tax=Methylomagnum ishizawai TaxID=1760988 RepID=A0A1Y6D020_9GAMM|nr:hypothetical protein [Methylomagnum ishizawai]SMF93912.1 hypothetical protein SAMN02949497_1208 [Methylomagnum ishizawai]